MKFSPSALQTFQKCYRNSSSPCPMPKMWGCLPFPSPPPPCRSFPWTLLWVSSPPTCLFPFYCLWCGFYSTFSSGASLGCHLPVGATYLYPWDEVSLGFSYSSIFPGSLYTFKVNINMVGFEFTILQLLFYMSHLLFIVLFLLFMLFVEGLIRWFYFIRSFVAFVLNYF